MRNPSHLLFCLLLALGLGLAGCGGLGDQAGAGSGEVLAVDRGDGTVTLDHGEIPGLMKAMRMKFVVEDPTILDGVSSGDTVDFRVRYADGRYTVTAIEPR